MTKRAFVVSNPIPLFPPVTIMILPDRSGISLADQVGFDGKLSRMNEYIAPMV
jgi:hypothetical protein